jgi:hypothetical protein
MIDRRKRKKSEQNDCGRKRGGNFAFLGDQRIAWSKSGSLHTTQRRNLAKRTT